MESFFLQDHPDYELLFSVADPADPCLQVLRELLSLYPQVPARLFVGSEAAVGPNPKVNNLIHVYEQARFDRVLISDSNVRVPRTYLRSAMAALQDDVGIVTATVAGVEPSGCGAHLESVFLNTFYARWMFLAPRFGNPVVIGKSMLFRRSDADRFGGLRTLGCYLAEDYMAGQAMRHLGKRITIMGQPVRQPLPNYSLTAFWSRHLRWGRIRKSQAGLLFWIEPMFSFLFSGAAGAFAFQELWGVPPLAFFYLHSLVWLGCDLIMMSCMGAGPGLSSLVSWAGRELLSFPLWLHISAGRSVNWRGHRLVVRPGGLLEPGRLLESPPAGKE